MNYISDEDMGYLARGIQLDGEKILRLEAENAQLLEAIKEIHRKANYGIRYNDVKMRGYALKDIDAVCDVELGSDGGHCTAPIILRSDLPNYLPPGPVILEKFDGKKWRPA